MAYHGAELTRYMRRWRKDHPGYHRRWMRANRGSGLIGRNAAFGMKHILGVLVGFDYWRPLHAR